MCRAGAGHWEQFGEGGLYRSSLVRRGHALIVGEVMPMSTFAERIDQLKEMVGSGDLTGMVEVDQRYAAIQHNSLDFRHPRGGQALYLSQPLMTHRDRYLQHYADRVLSDGGEGAMAENMEDLAEEGGVATHAPVLYSNLRASGHPSVTSDGKTVYDRPPRQRRLTDEELKAIYREHHPVPSKYSEKELRFLWSRGV